MTKIGFFLGAGLLLIAGCGSPPEPVPQDILDGVYANQACPSFEIENGRITFDGRQIAGEVKRGKRGYYLETEQALRYEVGADGCRFVVAEDGELLGLEREEFASPVVMLQLLSADRAQSMDWTRAGPPGELPAKAEKESTP